MPLISPPPLSLYLHIPWCVRKCPYCDFNSYQQQEQQLPEQAYIEALIADLEQDLPSVWGRPLSSIFIGGGTPSLFSAQAIEQIIQALAARLTFTPFMEITMEANPGTFEQAKFAGFRAAGINRLSIGVQSFSDPQLKKLGRIHGAEEAKKAIALAKEVGFDNFNIDLMHGLPGQTPEAALHDLRTALSFEPSHLSWYQLTMEPNTVFAKFPPKLPNEEILFAIQEQGHALLAQQGYHNYEVSAYSQADKASSHNLNYWRFGDYLGIGAGAHGKITDINSQSITRTAKTRSPKDYLDPSKAFLAKQQVISQQELPLEFLMNALRLTDGVPQALFEQRTGLPLDSIKPQLEELAQRELLDLSEGNIKTTTLGRRFLNDCLSPFLD